MSRYTEVKPSFWIKDLVKNQPLRNKSVFYQEKTGAFSISRLPNTKIGISVTVHATNVRPTLPGNYRGWKTINVPSLTKEGRENLNVSVQQIMRLVRPWDNSLIASTSGSSFAYESQLDGYFVHDPAITFRWKKVAGAVVYQLDIRKYRDALHPFGYKKLGQVLNKRVSQTVYETTLPPLEENTHYDLELRAYSGTGVLVGRYMTTYSSGHSWSYRFKVRSD